MKISDKTNLTGTQRRKLSLGLLLLLISGGIVLALVLIFALVGCGKQKRFNSESS